MELGQEVKNEENKEVKVKVVLTPQQLDTFIKEAITTCLKIYTGFKANDTLVVTLYNVLTSMFVDDKNHVILSAPTGTGKSVIGYMINFCFIYMTERIEKSNDTYENFRTYFNPEKTSITTYTLTSSKLLQEQIDGDIDRFGMVENLAVLKGVRNYECTKLTEETGIYHNYSERFCAGMSPEERYRLPCNPGCPYISQRAKVSNINNAVLNYAYFLSVLKGEFNPFFGIRNLTICDESHLIPDIVSSSFNIDLSMMSTHKLIDIYKSLRLNFPSYLTNKVSITLKGDKNEKENENEIVIKNKETFILDDVFTSCINKLFKFFTTPLTSDSKGLDSFLDNYWTSYKTMANILATLLARNINNEVFIKMYSKDFNRFIDYVEFNDYDGFIEELKTRPEDLFVESTEVAVHPFEELKGVFGAGRYKIYKQNIYDLSESAMCRKHFLSKVDKAVYMSATLGNIDEFAVLMGLKPNEYAGFRLESNFDYSKSPIYLTDSGYLNYSNFENNIDNVLDDCINICDNFHPNEKGIIHTSTFNISNRLKNKIVQTKNPERFLFYNNSQEKELMIERLKTSNEPLIIVGPSLFEGIDLKDDLGRFNITLKAPYSGMSNYTKKKMERYQFWYKRVVLEKLEQAIGRTNRHINDKSTNYMLDSVINKLIFELPNHITSRVSFKKLFKR